jgi:glycosyltransferase involved in cell wall biosynthesis
VETNTVKHRLARIFPIDEQRIFVVGNTVSPFFSEGQRPQTHRAKQGELNILVPASYYPHKNLEFIPEVAQRLQPLVPHSYMFTFCLPPDSKGWRQICSKARLMGVDHSIRTVGYVPHAKFYQLYADADAVFLPTLLECSSAVYPESFTAGVPLVTTDADFSRELCGEAALYCSPTNARQAAEQLSRALNDPQTQKAMITLGRERLSTHYLTPEMKWEAQLGLLYDLSSKSFR